ncbi:hypothetical protein SAMN05216378_1160 [Paenibacillus catalpae]|uniref:Uncharacterized protein n=1 Tax=Paenibacillus catalpae TaxID=1045775 RepID=A0A1I1UXE3_9BACL|nr:hypothetical protein SAMN05216378_1160 [Paenibacillus catalpae]
METAKYAEYKHYLFGGRYLMAYPVYLYKEYEDEETVIYKFSIKHYDSISDYLDKFVRIQLNKKKK